MMLIVNKCYKLFIMNNIKKVKSIAHAKTTTFINDVVFINVKHFYKIVLFIMNNI